MPLAVAWIFQTAKSRHASVDDMTFEFFHFLMTQSALTALISGTIFGFVAGLIPGIGGRTGLLLALPVAIYLGHFEGLVFLVAMHSVVHTSGSIPSIAYGLPTSAADAATVVDGFPLARQGRAGLALGASLIGSSLGGILGAVAFLVCIPFARNIITHLGPPEILLLCLLGISFVVSLSGKSLLQGLVAACLGFLIGAIGLDPITAKPRFTFGLLELWDGISIAAVIAGLFVIPEVMERHGQTDETARNKALNTGITDILSGMKDAMMHWRVIITSSVYGIVIGILPGIGASVACWMAYAHAARTYRSEIPYGNGAIPGVIAPESANNAKEGGALLPTLFFGIPGSSSMAILLGAMTIIGIRPGSSIIGFDLFIPMLCVSVLVLANLVSIPLFLLSAPSLVRFAAFNQAILAPASILAAVTASLIITPQWTTIMQIGAFATIGMTLKAFDWPRVPILLAIILAPLAESSTYKSIAIYGWNVFSRPSFLVLLIVSVAILFFTRHRAIWWPERVNGRWLAAISALFILLFVSALKSASNLPLAAAILPFAASVFGIATALACLYRGLEDRHQMDEPKPLFSPIHLAALLTAVPLIGILPSTFVFLYAAKYHSGATIRAIWIASAIISAMQVAAISTTFGWGAQPIFNGYLWPWLTAHSVLPLQ